MNADVTPGGSTGQDPTMVPAGTTGYSHQAVPPYPEVPTSAFLHCAHILLCLSLLFLHHLLAPIGGTQGL